MADDYRVPISVLENVASGLQQRGFDHWADVKLCVVNGDVSFLDPETGQIEGVTTGQYAIVEIVDVISEVHDNIVKLRNRSPEDYGKFRNKRHVMRNSTVFSGTRIPISAVRRFLEAGYSSKEILKQYPSLTDADIQAVINQLDKTKLAG
ncbi:MAG: DUF433 domain-containing protein [Ahrensia sp.]|nr:DUF433 domain-containing protein [Ahrensia sp.]